MLPARLANTGRALLRWPTKKVSTAIRSPVYRVSTGSSRTGSLRARGRRPLLSVSSGHQARSAGVLAGDFDQAVDLFRGWYSVRISNTPSSAVRVFAPSGDLRHSFASRALALGEGLFMIGKLLGHTQVQTTAWYTHLDRDTVKASAARIGDSIDNDLDAA